MQSCGRQEKLGTAVGGDVNPCDELREAKTAASIMTVRAEWAAIPRRRVCRRAVGDE